MKTIRSLALMAIILTLAGCESFPDNLTAIELNCGSGAQLSNNIDTLMNQPFIWLKSYVPFNDEPMTAKYSLLTLNQQE